MPLAYSVCQRYIYQYESVVLLSIAGKGITMRHKIYLSETLERSQRTAFLNDRIRRQKPGISIERARLVTEADRLTQGGSVIVKRAQALKHVLEHMRVYILDEELIVGHHADQLRYAPMFPEICSFSEEELDLCPKRKVDTLQISEEDKRCLLEEIYPY